MNDTLALMHQHRSIRRYTDDPIIEDDIRRAVEAGQSASTSSAVQAYALIRIRDEARRRALVTLTGGQDKVAASGAFFAVCGDTRRHRLLVERDGGAYRSRLEAFLLAVIDATLFAQNLVLAFEAMGYGVCYIGGLRNDLAAIDELLGVPEGVYPLYGLCVGRPAEAPSPRPRLPVDAVLFDDAYPADEAMLALIDAYDSTYMAYLDERGVEPERRKTWSTLMARKFSHPERADLASYYKTKGADLT